MKIKPQRGNIIIAVSKQSESEPQRGDIIIAPGGVKLLAVSNQMEFKTKSKTYSTFFIPNTINCEQAALQIGI